MFNDNNMLRKISNERSYPNQPKTAHPRRPSPPRNQPLAPPQLNPPSLKSLLDDVQPFTLIVEPLVLQRHIHDDLVEGLQVRLDVRDVQPRVGIHPQHIGSGRLSVAAAYRIESASRKNDGTDRQQYAGIDGR